MPGRRFREIDAAAQQVIAAAGFGPNSVHRSGHGVGLGLHEYPTDTAFNEETMRNGEVVAVEPGIYVRGFGGFRHSDTLVVSAAGPEILTAFPKDLRSLTIR
jgi:Xaa-Pro dipeptidase